MRDSRIVVVLAVLFGASAVPSVANANLAGTDLNLSAHPATGGMAGAGYTFALEPSAALFGNPASLTQMKGIRFNLGATYFHFFGNNQNQEFAGLENTSTSSATDYLLPVTAATFEIVDDLVMGFGIEVDTGAGADYRLDPVTLLGTPTDTTVGGNLVPGTTVPVLAQIITFNGNLGIAYQIAEKLSIGASFSLGFGLLQVGTAGNTTGLDVASGGLVENFGGTTSTVQDFGFGGSVGLNLTPVDGFYLSVAYKSAMKYRFEGVVSTTVSGAQEYQNLNVQQPQEVVFGVAIHDIVPHFLLAFDVAWKNWENADTYRDLFKNQFLLMAGAQYVVADVVSLRVGYSYATPVLRNPPNNTVGGLEGLGTVPLGDAGEPFSSAVTSIVQTALTPLVWEHNITAGVGIGVTDKVSLDAYASVSLPNTVSRSPSALSEALSSPVVYETDVKATLWIGAGVRVAIGHDPDPGVNEVSEVPVAVEEYEPGAAVAPEELMEPAPEED